jgi:hypothetical protein
MVETHPLCQFLQYNCFYQKESNLLFSTFDKTEKLRVGEHGSGSRLLAVLGLEGGEGALNFICCRLLLSWYLCALF